MISLLYPLSYAHLSCTIMGIYHQHSGRSLWTELSSFLPSECRRFFSVWARLASEWHLDLELKAMMMLCPWHGRVKPWTILRTPHSESYNSFFWLSISSPARRCSRYHLLVTTATARELRPLWPHPGLGPEPELKLAGEDMMSRVTLHRCLCHVDQSSYSCWQRSARVNYTWHSDHSEPNLWSGRRSLAVTTAPPSSEI